MAKSDRTVLTLTTTTYNNKSETNALKKYVICMLVFSLIFPNVECLCKSIRAISGASQCFQSTPISQIVIAAAVRTTRHATPMAHTILLLLLLLFIIRLLGDIAESDSAYCDRCYRGVVRLSVWSSVALVYPAKAVGRNEIPRDRDTRMVSSNTG